VLLTLILGRLLFILRVLWLFYNETVIFTMKMTIYHNLHLVRLTAVDNKNLETE